MRDRYPNLIAVLAIVVHESRSYPALAASRRPNSRRMKLATIPATRRRLKRKVVTFCAVPVAPGRSIEELAGHGLGHAFHHALPDAGDGPADLRLAIGGDPGAGALGCERHQDLALRPAGCALPVAAKPVAGRLVLVGDLDAARVAASNRRHSQLHGERVLVRADLLELLDAGITRARTSGSSRTSQTRSRGYARR